MSVSGETTFARSDAEHLTSPGAVLGTVAYMSPEQVRGKELDARSDLFSFGAVLYEMATGQLAFSGSSAGAICGLIVHRQVAPPSKINPQIAPALESIITKALEKDRELRYQRAAEMRSDLQRLPRDRESRSTSATGTIPARPGGGNRWSMAAALVALAAGAAATYFFVYRPAPKLSAKDTIVLSDFINSTGDAVFDGTLRQGLAAQLEQSPFLSLISTSASPKRWP